jgi:thiosulfate reductase cytochrome b subunit
MAQSEFFQGEKEEINMFNETIIPVQSKKYSHQGEKKIYIYRSFERFWHWMQATLIFFLGFTGFEIHGSISFFGYGNAVKYHNIAAYSFIVLIIFAIFWHFSTGEWKQYLPTRKNFRAYINFYLVDIFKNAPHPGKKTVLSKLNPLQKIVYLGLKLLVIPVMVISGLLYMFYRYPQKGGGIEIININSIEPIALVHTFGAFLLVAFVIAHLYLITTGSTITSNLKAMITGYEEAPHEQVLSAGDGQEQVQEQAQEAESDLLS